MRRDPGDSPLERSMLIEQAAELLGVSRRTIYYRIREGRLRTIRTRCHSQRVLLSSIFELLRSMRELEAARRAARQTPEPRPDGRVTVRDGGV